MGRAGKSLVDYVKVSQCFYSRFNNFKVDDPNILSDHCRVYFSFFLTETDSPAVGNTPVR